VTERGGGSGIPRRLKGDVCVSSELSLCGFLSAEFPQPIPPPCGEGAPKGREGFLLPRIPQLSFIRPSPNFLSCRILHSPSCRTRSGIQSREVLRVGDSFALSERFLSAHRRSPAGPRLGGRGDGGGGGSRQSTPSQPARNPRQVITSGFCGILLVPTHKGSAGARQAPLVILNNVTLVAPHFGYFDPQV
jgi:hypothetical protein